MRLNKEKEFYTIKELINAGFGSRSTIYRHIKEDGLPAIGRRRVAEGAHEWYLRMLKG